MQMYLGVLYFIWQPYQSGSRGTYLRKVPAVRGLQGLVGRLQKLLRALQSSRAGSQLVLQAPWHREKRHLTPLPQALPGLPTAFGMQGTMPFSNCRWEREAGPLQAGHQNHLGIPSLEMHMPRPHLSPGLHIPQGWESGVLGGCPGGSGATSSDPSLESETPGDSQAGIWQGVMPSDLGHQWEGLRNWKRWVRTGGEEKPDVRVGLQPWRGGVDGRGD